MDQPGSHTRAPTRKPHSKSRLGCVPCKKRRVKCDEQGPPCVNCVVRRVETQCFYIGRPPPPATRDVQSSTAQSGTPVSQGEPSSPAATPDSPAQGSTSASSDAIRQQSLPPLRSLNLSSLTHDRLVELELMRQWCSKSHLTAVRVETDIPIWLDLGTDIAFKHSFLMDMILATSSLQLGAEQTDKTVAARYVSRALLYQDSATVGARVAAANASADNYDALYLFSVLNTGFSMVSPQLPSTPTDHPKTPIQGVLTSFQLVLMIDQIISIGREYIENSPCARHNTRTAMLGEWQEQSRAKLTEPLCRLRVLAEAEMAAGNIDQSCCKAHRDALDWLFRSNEEETIMCIALLAWAGWSFVEDVKAGNESALLILLYWGVMIREYKLMWWAQFVGLRVVDEISHKLIGQKSAEWDAAISWARLMVGLPSITTGEP